MNVSPPLERTLVFILLALQLAGGGLLAKEEPTYQSHAPMRPPPTAIERPLGKGYFVDAAKGNDTAEGSKDKPWKTVQHGADRLKPGETLYLRGGVYYEKVRLTRSGSAEAPVVVASYPGELAIIDGGFAEFAKSPATSWEPVKDGAEGEYISTKTYAHVDDRVIPNQFIPANWEPMWGIENERPLVLGNFADSMIPLHGYRSLRDLRSSNEVNLGDKKLTEESGLYCGPGLWFDRETGRIHVRLAHNQLPGLGDRSYQGETDPRKLPLVVAAGFGDAVLRVNGVRHVKLEGLVLRGATGSPMIEIYGSEKIALDHLTVFGGFPDLLINASKDVLVSNSAFRGLAAPWSGRSHMKYFGTASYVIVLQNNQPINENIDLSWNEFTDGHDFAFLRYAKNLQFHHNFVDNFNDDGIECGPKLRSHSMFIHENRIGPCLGVFQQHESDKDESPVEHDPKSGIYIYRNVIDQRPGVWYMLPKEADPTGSYLHAEGHIFGDHGSPTYPLMRVYQNTILRRTPVFRDAYLFGMASALKNTERDVFNNILVQIDRLPGAGFNPKDLGPLREGGNVLWGMKDGAAFTGDLFAKFRAGPQFAESKKFYEPGWTTYDRLADPKFTNLPVDDADHSDLRLRAESPAIQGGQPLPADWPDPLRDAGNPPDSGALPHHAEPWTVGVDGRIPLFGGSLKTP